MSNVAANIKIDDNSIRNGGGPIKPDLKQIPAARRPLGEMRNRIKPPVTQADQIKKGKEATQTGTQNLPPLKLKEIKPRVDTHWAKNADVLKKPQRTNSLRLRPVVKNQAVSTAQIPNGARLVKAKTIDVQVPKKVIIQSVRREESNLSRQSLTKLKAVLKKERQTSTSSSSSNENLAVKVSSHSTILLSEIDNIDDNDASNLMLVSEYVNDIYTYLNSLELEFPIQKDFLDNQTEVTPKMRGVLIDWINEVHLQFRLLPETYYMTVAIIDRYLCVVKNTSRKNLQLVGVTALFIASKYEELYPPEIKDFVYITDNTYTAKQVLQMEINICRKLGSHFGRPLPIHFLRRFSKAANSENMSHTIAKYFIELATVHYSLAHIRPSEIAAASLMLSLRLLKKQSITEVWSKTLEFYTTYSANHLKPLVQELAQIVLDAPDDKLKAVFVKYSTIKYQQIPSLPQIRSGKMLKQIRDGQ